MALGSQFIDMDSIMVFSRVEADGIDAFMDDGDLVLATVEDMGFDQEDMMGMLTRQGGDPGALYSLMEGRWSGEETNFSFEKLWSMFTENVGGEGNKLIHLIEKEGRDSQIYTEVGAIRVLSPGQVQLASDGLAELTLSLSDSVEDENEQSLKTLFPALQTFFKISADEGEFVLVSFL